MKSTEAASQLALAGGSLDGLKPPLKWAGGKRWQVKHLLPIWRRYADRRLVEPFCGGLAMAIGLMPKRALLNDVNPHLIHFYEWLRRGLIIDLPMMNSKSCYDSYRERFNLLLAEDKADSAEASSLFYYLNRTGYNGLCRFNSQGRFNVPFGRYTQIPYRTDFTDYAAVLQEWEFTALDFERVSVNDDDFIYADPPYDVEFTQYSRHGFDWDDQVRVAEWLASHAGPAVLSNQATERIEKLYRGLGFKLIFLQAPRRISCNGDRTPAAELLALRNIDGFA